MRKNRGITIVALIITVIILIILAGISISLVLGENGILQRASRAEREYQEAKEKENRDLDELYSSIQIATDSKITLDTEKLDEYINSKIEEKTAKIQELEDEINNLKPVNLYSGSTKENFVLKQSMDGFKTIEIIYSLSNSKNGIAKFYMKATPEDLKSGIALNAFSRVSEKTNGNAFMQMFSCKLTIDSINAIRSDETYAVNIATSTNFNIVNNRGNISVEEVNGYY